MVCIEDDSYHEKIIFLHDIIEKARLLEDENKIDEALYQLNQLAKTFT